MSRKETETLNRYFKRATAASQRLKVAERAHERAIINLWVACDIRLGDWSDERLAIAYNIPRHRVTYARQSMGIVASQQGQWKTE